MTISTTTNKISYTGNGIAVEFAIPFPFLDASHLKVWQLSDNVQKQRTDWTERNGNLVFKTAPASGAKILIMREIPLTQETDYRENEILPAETLERNFDRLTMQVQQLYEKIQRSVMVDVFDNTQTSDLLPQIHRNLADTFQYAQTAKEQAQSAGIAAQTANKQAVIATNKAQQAAETLGNKAEKDFSNCTKPYITETYHEGANWYRIWSDGWIEQGGTIMTNATYFNVYTFLKPFKNTDYFLNTSLLSNGAAINGCQGASCKKESETTFSAYSNYVYAHSVLGFCWTACGF